MLNVETLPSIHIFLPVLFSFFFFLSFFSNSVNIQIFQRRVFRHMWMEFLYTVLILTDHYRVSLPAAMAPPAWAVDSAFNVLIMAMLHKRADPGGRAV